MKNKKMIWIIFGVGSGLVIIFFCVVAATMLWHLSRNPKIHAYRVESENIINEFDFPEKVSLGKPYVVEINISNTSEFDQRLDSIDFETDYLEGISILGVDPHYLQTRDFSVGIYRTFDFQITIPANETITVTFLMSGAKVGEFSSEFYICINDETLCDLYIIDTTVVK